MHLFRYFTWMAALAAVWATCGVAQQPAGPPGGFGFGLPQRSVGASALLAIRQVRDELRLTDEQAREVDQALRSMQAALDNLTGEIDFREIEGLSDRERRQRFDDWRTRTDRVIEDANDELLAPLDEQQKARLGELQRQRGGVRALLAAAADALKLTDEQRAKLATLAPPAGPFDGFGPPPDVGQQMAGALAILTDDQRGAWANLTGAEFRFPADGGFARGFGGPGRPFGGPGGPFGGPGRPGGETRKVLAKFDKNHDGWLNQAERKAARDDLAAAGDGRRGPGGGGPFGGPGGGRGGPFGRTQPGTPGPQVDPDDVPPASGDLYDSHVVRTLFLEFDDDQWEAELEAFHGTDVDVPATLTVDGQKYPLVGVRFRGMSSYMMLPTGSKRSLNLSLDMVDPEQRVLTHKTLNLLNSHEDPTFMHTVLYSHIARQYIAAPRANFVRLVINGRSWGLYINAEQFDKIMLAANYPTGAGTRWKVSGSPGARGGLEYLGDDAEAYRSRFEIKGGDDPAAWEAFIALCRTLNETPSERLVEALEPMLDLDETLKFLAVDVALVNSDGYWTRASDYSLYRDPAGKFHLIPHDMNEALQPPMGPGMGGGRGRGGRDGRTRGGFGGSDAGSAREGGPPPNDAENGRREVNVLDNRPDERSANRPDKSSDVPPSGPGQGFGAPGDFGPPGFFLGFRPPGGPAGPARYDLDPLIALDDPSKPLRSKLLAIPELRARYLAYVREIARDGLDWNRLGPLVAENAALIVPFVEADTRKLSSIDEFRRAIAPLEADAKSDRHNLHEFATKRREFLLDYSEPKESVEQVRRDQ